MSEMLPFIRNYFWPFANLGRRTNGVNPTVTPRLTASDEKRRRPDQFLDRRDTAAVRAVQWLPTVMF